MQIYEQFAPIDEKDLIGLYETMLKQKGIRDKWDVEEEEMDAVEMLPVESMFLPALYEFLKGRKGVFVADLQRALQIGYALGAKIFDALVRMGIVDNSDPKNSHKIVKDNIDLLLPYMKIKMI